MALVAGGFRSNAAAPVDLVRATPEDCGIRSSSLATLVATLEREGLDPHALVVARHGRVVFDAAWMPYRADRAALSYSATKTFTSVAIGFLEAEGRLELDDSVGDLLGLPNPNGLTVRNLLTMNTGHSAEQIEGLAFDVRALLSVPPASAPASRFGYNSDATYALSRIVSAVTGESLTGYLRPRLLDPLGIGERWMSPLFGIEQGFSGFYLTAEDIVRLAMTLADGGRFAGAQVIPAAYVADLQKPWSDSRDPDAPVPAEGDPLDWAQGYGFQVWRSSRGFRIDGAYGQFGLAIPELELAIGYQGASRDTAATLRAMWDFADAVTDEGLPADAAASAALQAARTDLDSWHARGVLTVDPLAPIDSAGWTVAQSDGGWSLRIPGDGVLPPAGVRIGSQDWAETVIVRAGDGDRLDAPVPVVGPEIAAGTHVALAARGERSDAGGLLLHVVNATSPHRIIVTVSPSGAIEAGWHTAPLWKPILGTLAVSPVVLADAR